MIEEIKEELSQSQTNVAQDLFKQIDSNQRSKLKSFESSKTLIIYNNNCLNHGKLTESNPIKRIKRRQLHTENPDRVNVLLQPPFGILLSDFFMQRFVLRESPKKAYLADILRCHDFLYVDKIKALCKDLATQGSDLIFKYDSDTHINSHTWDSALYACGSVIDAVDQVMTGEYSNALVLVRPPGHHAGYFGKVE